MFNNTKNINTLPAFYSEVDNFEIHRYLCGSRALRPGHFCKVNKSLIIALSERDALRYGVSTMSADIILEINLHRNTTTGFVALVVKDDGEHQGTYLAFAHQDRIYGFDSSEFAPVRTITVDNRRKTKPATEADVKSLQEEVSKLRKELEKSQGTTDHKSSNRNQATKKPDENAD